MKIDREIWVKKMVKFATDLSVIGTGEMSEVELGVVINRLFDDIDAEIEVAEKWARSGLK